MICKRFKPNYFDISVFLCVVKIKVRSWHSVLFSGRNRSTLNKKTCHKYHEQACCFGDWDCFPIWETDICDTRFMHLTAHDCFIILGHNVKTLQNTNNFPRTNTNQTMMIILIQYFKAVYFTDMKLKKNWMQLVKNKYST